MKKSFLFYFLIYLIILGFVFRSLIFNLSTNLIDWRDYAAVNFLIHHNVSKILALDFNNYFDTNAFYPNKYSLLFSDTFIPQALMEIPFYLVTNNVILSFNSIFILTFILNFIAAFIFWKHIFKKSYLAFFGSLLIVFSPYTHLQLDHFQMLFFWPFFLTLFFIFKSQETKKTRNLLLAGLFLAIQFLASVYISFYLIFAILFFYLIEFLKSSNERLLIIRNLAIIFIVFLLIDGYFIKGYIDTKKLYDIHYDLRVNVSYSAHLSDYLFTTHINSLLHKSNLMQIWNNYNKNFGGGASFPGFLLSALFIYGLVKFKYIKNILAISLPLNKEEIFFLGLTITGFLFSLGPRLNFNGAYAYIVTPYTLLLKLIPLVEEIRVPSRWYFILIVGFVYFSLVAIKKIQIKAKAPFILSLIIILFFIEYIPINLTTESKNYITLQYQILREICIKKKNILLEVPITHFDAGQNIAEGVSYIATTELSASYHQCYLINGYTSFDMPSLLNLKDSIYQDITKGNISSFINELENNNVDIVKFNPDYFIKEVSAKWPEFLQKMEENKKFQKLDNNLYLFKKRQLLIN